MKSRRLLSSILLAMLIGAVARIGCAQPATSDVNAAQAVEIPLPAPSLTGKVSVEEALAKRRSIRSFTQQDLSLEQIGQLAWAAQGITDPQGHRTAPSAIAVYPLELYLVKGDGVFRYVPEGHKLAKLSSSDVRAQLCGQASVREAPLDFVIVGDSGKAARFGGRAERFMSIEAGHVAQNIHLEAVALGLGSVSVGGYKDEDVTKALALTPQDIPLYIIPVGYPKPK
jgi:SagB-type dehydrogenase family enzyme